MAKPYSNQAAIVEAISTKTLAQLTDDAAGASIDTDIVEGLIEKADATIETYARGKNILPFSSLPNTPEQVQTWSVNLTIFHLYKRRLDLEVPDAIRTDYDDTIEDLEKLRDNNLLIDDALSAANTGSLYKSGGASKKKLFTTNADGTGTLDDYYDGPDSLCTSRRLRSS